MCSKINAQAHSNSIIIYFWLFSIFSVLVTETESLDSYLKWTAWPFNYFDTFFFLWTPINYNEEQNRNVYLQVFERGSRGPSTVTLIALVYVATCGGLVDIVIVTEKLFPAKPKKKYGLEFFLLKIGYNIYLQKSWKVK